MPIPRVPGAMKLPPANGIFLMAKLLTPSEYEFIGSRGVEGAREIIERFERNQTHHLSSLHRASVV